MKDKDGLGQLSLQCPDREEDTPEKNFAQGDETSRVLFKRSF